MSEGDERWMEDKEEMERTKRRGSVTISHE